MRKKIEKKMKQKLKIDEIDDIIESNYKGKMIKI